VTIRRLTRTAARPGDRCGYRKGCREAVEFDYVVSVTPKRGRPYGRLKKVCGECAKLIAIVYPVSLAGGVPT
jgi:hypothetical protein